MHATSKPGLGATDEQTKRLEDALDRGDLDRARELLSEVEGELGPAHPSVRLMSVRVRWIDRGAEAIVDELAALSAEHPGDADVHHLLGVAYEELGERARMIEAFTATLRLDAMQDEAAGAFPPSLLDAIEARARAVLDSLPAELARRLSKVPVILETRPSEHLVAEGFDPRALGLFEGAMMADRDLAAPSRIVLYVHNLFEATDDDDELLEEVEVTVLHEVGHFFGLDEDEVSDLGLA